MIKLAVGFFGIGAGVLSLGLVMGSPVYAAILLAALGISYLGWALYSWGSIKASPAIGLSLAVLGILSPLLFIGLESHNHSGAAPSPGGENHTTSTLLPIIVLVTLSLIVAVLSAVQLRKGRASNPSDAKNPSVLKILIISGLCAGLVGALVTPALAETEAGKYAVPHGEHFS